MTAATMAVREAEKLLGQVRSQEAEEASLVEEIAALRRQEADAVEAALRAGKPSRGPGSRAEGLRRKREAAERKLVDVREFELPAARRVASEAAAQLRAAKIGAAEEAARSFDPLEQQAIDRLAGAYDLFVRAFATLAETAELREEVYAQLESEGLVAALSEQERWELHKAFQSTLVPFPRSPLALFEAMREAVLNPHAGDETYAESFQQRYRLASRFVEQLAELREERGYRRVSLRLTEMRSEATS